MFPVYKVNVPSGKPIKLKLEPETGVCPPENFGNCAEKSGVALRFPPQSMTHPD
jgi:hypothetical protein